MFLHAPTVTKGSTNTGEHTQSSRKNHTALNNYEGTGQKVGDSPQLNLEVFCIINEQRGTRKSVLWVWNETRFSMPHTNGTALIISYNGHFCVRSILMELSKHSWGTGFGEEVRLEKKKLCCWKDPRRQIYCYWNNMVELTRQSLQMDVGSYTSSALQKEDEHEEFVSCL